MVLPSRVRRSLGSLCALGAILLIAGTVHAVSSYPVSATDEPGSSTGSGAVALGVPDYLFVNDSGLGYGGSNTDVFDVGEATVLAFPAALRNVAGEDDLLVSALVGGLGETDSANVQVEVSDDGANYVVAGTFDTATGRTTYPFFQERNFESVKHFSIDFGTEDFVTHVRLTNLSGTAEGLRLDAVEGLHPVVGSSHAFEIRFDRFRNDSSERFKIRLKNIGDVGGVAIRGTYWGKLPEFPWMEETVNALESLDGDFICVDNCVDDADGIDGVANTTHRWSVDGVTEAPPGVGLDPGRRAANDRRENYDIDTGVLAYLSGFEFTVTWTDGYEHTFDYDNDVLGQGVLGQQYQKYGYFSSNPSLSGPRPADYYEFILAGGTDCSDGQDNDGDGLIDLADPGCDDGADAAETSPGLPCDDGLDNDGDLLADSSDPGCRDPLWLSENPACNDGIDNDNDGFIDLADLHCVVPYRTQEKPWQPACGLGFEIALLLPLLRRRRRHAPSAA